MKKLIIVLGIAFVVLEAADAFLTLWATNNGFQEVNPLMVSIAHTWIFPFIKIVPALAVTWALTKLTKRFPGTRPIIAFGFFAAIMLLGIVLASNVAEL